MRLSIHTMKGDAAIVRMYVAVTVDGVPQTLAIMADEEAGVVDRYVWPITDDGGGRAQIERVEGRVEINLHGTPSEVVQRAFARLRAQDALASARAADLPMSPPAA